MLCIFCNNSLVYEAKFDCFFCDHIYYCYITGFYWNNKATVEFETIHIGKYKITQDYNTHRTIIASYNHIYLDCNLLELDLKTITEDKINLLIAFS